jgi:hypothetical protein
MPAMKRAAIYARVSTTAVDRVAEGITPKQAVHEAIARVKQVADGFRPTEHRSEQDI